MFKHKNTMYDVIQEQERAYFKMTNEKCHFPAQAVASQALQASQEPQTHKCLVI